MSGGYLTVHFYCYTPSNRLVVERVQYKFNKLYLKKIFFFPFFKKGECSTCFFCVCFGLCNRCSNFLQGCAPFKTMLQLSLSTSSVLFFWQMRVSRHSVREELIQYLPFSNLVIELWFGYDMVFVLRLRRRNVFTSCFILSDEWRTIL